MFNKYKSWYDLSYQKASELEKEFISHDMGKDANNAMHICIIIGIVTFVFNSIVLFIMLFSHILNLYSFLILIMFIILGLLIVVLSTIEYHIKFNSWLYVSKNIVKK